MALRDEIQSKSLTRQGSSQALVRSSRVLAQESRSTDESIDALIAPPRFSTKRSCA
jgi:hypothetical protein